MTVIEEYTKEQILDFTWVNADINYILTDYYWQKFRKSVNPEFTTKKGSRKRFYSDRVYTQFCLWLVDLDISRARSPRRKVMQEIKEKLNEQKDELLSIGCAQDVFNASVERTDSVDIALTQVQKYVDIVTCGGIEAAREEAEKVRQEAEKVRQSEEIKRMDYIRENLLKLQEEYDIQVKKGYLTKEEAEAAKRSLALQATLRIDSAKQKQIEDATAEMRKLADETRYDRKKAIEYKNGTMTRPTVYVKVDFKDIYNKMPNYKIGCTKQMQRREEVSTSDNGHLKLVLAVEFDNEEEMEKAEKELHHWLRSKGRAASDINPKVWKDNHCREWFYLNKPLFKELKEKYNWKEYLPSKQIYKMSKENK